MSSVEVGTTLAVELERSLSEEMGGLPSEELD